MKSFNLIELVMEFSRRDFLSVAIKASVGLALAAPGVGYVSDICARNKATQSRIDQTLSASSDTPEILPRGTFIPEDERAGTDIMIGVSPRFSFVPLKKYVFEMEFSDTSPTNAVLKSLPAGTRVHVALPKEASSEYLTLAQAKYPHLEFHTYDSPVSYSGLTFVQDIVCAAGSQTESGQFNIAVNSLDDRSAKRYQERLAHWYQKIGDKGDELDGAYHILADEWLSEDYPETFKATKMPLSLTGGDLRPIRLPDGRSAVIVGQENFGRSLNFIRGLDVASDPVFYLDDLQQLVDQIKDAYKNYLSVDEVIILDEGRFLELGKETGWVDLREWENPDFFHADMMVACATGPNNGVPYAFVSNYEWKNHPANVDYSRRIQKQFENLGYKVLPLAVGHYPTMNYTNAIFLKDPDGQKTVILPQYGDQQKDRAAVLLYEAAGFKVITTDFSFIGGEEYMGHEATTGSARCSVAVLK